ncbi:hypothetical protein GCM10009551_046790 [Nocardiopsis tropica]
MGDHAGGPFACAGGKAGGTVRGGTPGAGGAVWDRRVDPAGVGRDGAARAVRERGRVGAGSAKRAGPGDPPVSTLWPSSRSRQICFPGVDNRRGRSDVFIVGPLRPHLSGRADAAAPGRRRRDRTTNTGLTHTSSAGPRELRAPHGPGPAGPPSRVRVLPPLPRVRTFRPTAPPRTPPLPRAARQNHDRT